MKDFDFDKAAALQSGSLNKFHQFALGEVYRRKKFQWFQKPVIANGPYGLKLRDLHVRHAVRTPEPGKFYDIEFRVVFLQINSVTIDILKLDEVL